MENINQAGWFGPTEIIIILVIVLLFFGGRKIPELMKGLGKGVKEFNNEIVDEYINEIKTTITIKNPFKVIIDCGNGVTGAITERIFNAFNVLYFSNIHKIIKKYLYFFTLNA